MSVCGRVKMEGVHFCHELFPVPFTHPFEIEFFPGEYLCGTVKR
jgi:hypothetical protein